MAIDTFEDIVSDVANWLGIYGAHGVDGSEGDDASRCTDARPCRACFESRLLDRMNAAAKIERKLSE